MKSLFFILTCLLCMSFVFKDITDDIAGYLKTSNTKALTEIFSDKVSIKILDMEDLVSKGQAQTMIDDFFSKHKVKNYTTAHSSLSNGGHQFLTGTLETVNGKFRISILVRGNIISQFRIENDNG